MHDRACELYYTLKGGTVDYGEEHAKACGHSRWGRTFAEGQYPSWSAEHPVHFIAHSLGGTTVTVLQMLIRDGHFGAEAHPDMISSVNTVAAPFRGTAFAYLLGKSYENSIDTRFFSVSDRCCWCCYVRESGTRRLEDAMGFPCLAMVVEACQI